jgi:hypothetical protein
VRLCKHIEEGDGEPFLEGGMAILGFCCEKKNHQKDREARIRQVNTTHTTTLMLALLTLLTALLAVSADPRLRGVPPALQPVYQSAVQSGMFSCGASGKIIPVSSLNDDFCDCEVDGADEPGTSACKNAKFYCQNQGFRGQYLYSSHVNDAICGMLEGPGRFGLDAQVASCQEFALLCPLRLTLARTGVSVSMFV